MDSNRRKPIRNFVFHKEIQVPLMKNILAVVCSSAFIACGVVLAVYFYYSQSGYLYFMSNDFEKPLIRQSFVGIALPGLLFAEGVTLVFGFILALLVSRRIAVPLYKLERWANAIAEGNLNVNLHFREKGQYRELMTHCNAAGVRMRNTLLELDRLLNDPAFSTEKDSPEVQHTLERSRALLREWRFKGSGEEMLP